MSDTGITEHAGGAMTVGQSENPDYAGIIPDKFNGDVAAMAAGYKALEARLSQQSSVTELGEDGAVSVTVDNTQSENFNASHYSNLWAENGGNLTDDQWQAASNDTGLSVDVLKAYGDSQLSQMQETSSSHDSAIYDSVGGEDTYNSMIEWAQSNLTEAQLANLDAQMDNPDTATMGALALQGLYKQNNTSEPEVSVTPSNGVQASAIAAGEYTNDAEMQAAMMDPRYGSDPLYQREVEQKAQRYMMRG